MYNNNLSFRLIVFAITICIVWLLCLTRAVPTTSFLTEEPLIPFKLIHPELLVLVLSSRHHVYDIHKAMWHALTILAPPEIKVFLIEADPYATQVIINGSYIFVPGPECITPCMLHTTMHALNATLNGTTLVKGIKWVLRTNLSSLFIWTRLLLWIRKNLSPPVHAGGSWAVGNELPSGCGNIMDVETAKLLLAANSSLDYQLDEDVAISQFVKFNLKIPYHSMPRTDYVPDDGRDFSNLPIDPDNGAFHYRVKAQRYREKYDGFVLSRIFLQAYYGFNLTQQDTQQQPLHGLF